MPQSDREFWQALQTTDLLSKTQRKWVKNEWFANRPSGSSPGVPAASVDSGSDKNGPSESIEPSTGENRQSLADKLVEKQWLTGFQANLIQRYIDRPAQLKPFRYGPFEITYDLQPPDFPSPHQYLACLTPENADRTFEAARFLLRFTSDCDDQVWERLKARVLNPGDSSEPRCIAPVASVHENGYRVLIEPQLTPDLQGLPRLLAEPAPSISTKHALRMIAGLATALEKCGDSQPLGLIDPSMVFVDKDKQAVLRTIPDVLLQQRPLARQILGLQPEQHQRNSDQPQIVTESGATPPAGREWKKELTTPVGTEGVNNWSSADFLAPEIMAGQAATPRSDLYSLGCLLHFLVLGKVPFAGESWDEKRLARQMPLELPDDCPKPIAKILQILLQSDPQLRKASAATVAQTLWTLLKSQPDYKAEFRLHPANDTARQWLDIQDSIHFQSETAKDESTAPEASIALPRVGSDTAPVVVPSFDTADESRPAKRWQKETASSPMPKIIAGSSIAVLALFLLAWSMGWMSGSTPTIAERPIGEDDQNTNVEPANTEVNESTANGDGTWEQKRVADDGKLLWESPTTGPPLVISDLPSGPFLLLSIRRSFWEDAPTDSLLRAIEGVKAAKPNWLPLLENAGLKEFDSLLVAQYQSNNQADHILQAQSQQGRELSLPGWKIVGKLPAPLAETTPAVETPATDPGVDTQSPDEASESEEATPVLANETSMAADAKILRLALVGQHNGSPLVAIVTASLPAEGDASAWAEIPLERLQPEMFDPEYAEDDWPAGMSVTRLTLASPQLAVELLQQTEPTELTLPMAQALECSDRDRQFQLIFNPVSIWNEAGRNGLGPDRKWLADQTKELFPPVVRAAYLAAHFEQGQCYLEAKFIADRSAGGQALLSSLRRKLLDSPGVVEREILLVPRLAFWDNGLLRFDDMLRVVSEYVRFGQHNKIPTMNLWLPDNAVPNLLAEVDLYFTATQYSGEALVAKSDGPPTPKDLGELLQTKGKVKIPEQDLINALNNLQDELNTKYTDLPFDFEIELDGTNLGLEGITQNQKISNFEQVDQTIADILTALVLTANPDKSVTSANQPGCKLIWLPHPDKPGTVLVTTRGFAEKQNWELPPQVAVVDSETP